MLFEKQKQKLFSHFISEVLSLSLDQNTKNLFYWFVKDIVRSKNEKEEKSWSEIKINIDLWDLGGPWTRTHQNWQFWRRNWGKVEEKLQNKNIKLQNLQQFALKSTKQIIKNKKRTKVTKKLQKFYKKEEKIWLKSQKSENFTTNSTKLRKYLKILQKKVKSKK